jgi:hypothetical protein
MFISKRSAPMVQSAIFAAGLLALSAATGFAQQRAADLMPLPGEQRLTLTAGGRVVAFPTKIAPIARETIPFASNGHAVTEEGRQAMTRLQEALFRQPGSSLILVVYGEDETLAFQRARAVRGELAERHSMDPARIVATGRKAEGHSGDIAVVDVFAADATRCGGCGGAPFRTIAMESGAVQLMTSMAEALPAARPAEQPSVVARQSTPPVQTAPRQRIAAPEAVPAAPTPAVAPRRIASAPQMAPAPAAKAATGCQRPKIIIDDYYPGGPIIPCRPQR